MKRRREQPWLLLAFVAATLVHLAAVGFLLSVDRRAPLNLAEVFAFDVSPAPAIVLLPPERDPPSTPIGEQVGDGDSVASVALPDRATAPQTFEFEQAWTRQTPVVIPPAEVPPETSQKQEVVLGPVSPTLVSPTVAPVAALMRPGETDEVGRRAETKTPEAPRAADPIGLTPGASEAAKASPPAPPESAAAGASDLDAFAKEEGVDFTRGAVKARTGRPVKITRPRVDLRFMADATALSARSVSIVLRIETDGGGVPRRVDVVKSSGSAEIDDAIRIAMYDSWFGGKMPDAFPFTITLWR